MNCDTEWPANINTLCCRDCSVSSKMSHVCSEWHVGFSLFVSCESVCQSISSFRLSLTWWSIHDLTWYPWGSSIYKHAFIGSLHGTLPVTIQPFSSCVGHWFKKDFQKKELFTALFHAVRMESLSICSISSLWYWMRNEDSWVSSLPGCVISAQRLRGGLACLSLQWLIMAVSLDRSGTRSDLLPLKCK